MSYSIKTYLVIFLLGHFVLFSSCMDNTPVTKTVEEIDLLAAYNRRTETPISDIATDIEYIRLETGEDLMLNDPHLINVKDSLILYIGFRKLYIFSRNTGKFLYEISSYGRGPGEYTATSNIYDEDKDLFIVRLGRRKIDNIDYSTFAGYNFNGEIIKTISRPDFFNHQNDALLIVSFWPLTDTTYVGYTDNINVNLPEKLIIFNRNGQFIKSYPSYNNYEKEETGGGSFYPYLGMFFNAVDTVRFFELHTDTIFNVNSHTIQPRYHIEMGDLLLPYQLWATQNFSEYFNYFHIRTMHESSRFLMFSVCLYGTSHMVTYDKTKKWTIVCNTTMDLDFYTFEDHWGSRCIGFSNDLDKFVPIGTNKGFYINRNDEFISAISALEVERWFDQNPDKAAKLPEHLQSYGDMSDEDNPIVIVAKLKK